MSEAIPMATRSNAGCARCERLPSRRALDGTLHLWPPLGHSISKLKTALQTAGKSRYESQEGCLSIAIDAEDHVAVVTRIAAALLSEEARATKVLFLPAGTPITIAAFQHATTLDRHVAVTGADWLVSILEAKRLTSWFQPIVSARDTSEVYAVEALLRATGEDGKVIPAGPIFEAARDADLLFQLDLAARLSAIECHAKLDLPYRLFINFSPASIYDPEFCLRRTVAAVDAAKIPHDRIVFEVVESDQARDLAHLRTVLTYYRTQGFKVALDDVGSGFSSLNLIHELRPDFVKLDMGLTRNAHADPYKGVVVEKLLEITRSLGITSVAEGIETIDELRFIQSRGADLVQGYLIARPSSAAPPVLPSLS